MLRLCTVLLQEGGERGGEVKPKDQRREMGVGMSVLRSVVLVETVMAVAGSVGEDEKDSAASEMTTLMMGGGGGEVAIRLLLPRRASDVDDKMC